jgi:hypothetical protein
MADAPAATRVRGRFVIGYDETSHVLLRDAEVVFAGDTVVFVGCGYDGPLAREIDAGNAVVAPGFVDLNALADLDSTILGFDNQPDHLKGRVWPEAYLRCGPREVYTAAEQDLGSSAPVAPDDGDFGGSVSEPQPDGASWTKAGEPRCYLDGSRTHDQCAADQEPFHAAAPLGFAHAVHEDEQDRHGPVHALPALFRVWNTMQPPMRSARVSVRWRPWRRGVDGALVRRRSRLLWVRRPNARAGAGRSG